MRKILRSIARHNMILAGINRTNRRMGMRNRKPWYNSERSFFASNWRTYVSRFEGRKRKKAA